MPVATGAREPTRSIYEVVGWAAVLIFGMGISLYYFKGLVIPPKEPVASAALVNQEEILRSIESEALSVQLWASANMLAQYQQGRPIAEKTYQYLAQMYPDTTAGQEAKRLLEKKVKEMH